MGLQCYCTIQSKHLDGTSTASISCVFSYLSVVVVELWSTRWAVLQNFWAAVLASTVLCVAAFSIIACLARSRRVNDWLTDTVNKTLYHDVIEATVDLRKGSVVKAYPKGKDYCYIGNFRTNDGTYLALASFAQWRAEDDTEVYSHADNPDAVVVLRFTDLEAIEVFNN